MSLFRPTSTRMPFLLSTLIMLVYGLESTTGSALFENIPLYRLNDGHFMPKIGVGVYRCEDGDETFRTVSWALELGVRLVDTAAMYGNEESVGHAISSFFGTVDNVEYRDKFFITTKLDTGDHGYVAAYEAAEYALHETLKTTYIDLFLIHSPFGGKIIETWDALVQLQRDGLVKSIGVSNFGVRHLEAIRIAGRPMPAVNQIEMHPLNYQRRKDLVEYCQQHNIVITAYGSLFSGWTEVLSNNELQTIANSHGKTIPQILLRWALAHGFAVIPKSSSSKERQRENYDILDFHLSTAEVSVLDNLSLDVDFDEYWNPIDESEDVRDLDLDADESEEDVESDDGGFVNGIPDDDEEKESEDDEEEGEEL